MVTKIVSLVFSSGHHMTWHQKITTTKKSAWQRPMLQWIQRLAPNSGGRFTWKIPNKISEPHLHFNFHVSFFGVAANMYTPEDYYRWLENGWRWTIWRAIYLYFLHKIEKMWVFHIAMLVYRSVKRLMSIPYRVFYWQNAPGVFPSLARYLASCWLS